MTSPKTERSLCNDPFAKRDSRPGAVKGKLAPLGARAPLEPPSPLIPPGLAGLQFATLFQEGVQQEPRPGPASWNHYCELSCQRAIHSDTDRPARMRSTFASICKGCSRKPRNGRCLGLSGCCEHHRDHVGARGKNRFHALHTRAKVRPGRRHVAALLRAMGVDDHRPDRAGHDRACSRPFEIRSAREDV